MSLLQTLTSLRSQSVHPANNRNATDWRARYYADLTREHGFEPLRIEGTVPKELSGTLYRAGPATSGRFGRPYVHMFEGDGAISAIRLHQGEARGAVRLLRSAGYLEEERARKPLYQSAASPLLRLAQGVRGRMKRTGNTGVMQWNDTLYALMEAAGPLAFDSELNTIGDSDLGGVVQGAFSAHPHTVIKRRASYNFGANWGPNGLLRVYELPWGGSARELAKIKLEHPVMLHDFMATENHLVFFVSPARFKLASFALGIGDASDFLAWHPEDGTEVIVIPIDQPERVVRFKVDPFFQIHFGAGFEDGDDLIVDVFRYDDSSAMRRNIQEIDKPPFMPTYARARVRPKAERVDMTTVTKTGTEFGSTDPRKLGERFRHMFAMTIVGTRDGLVRIDTETGKEDLYLFADGTRMGEPIFVPRSASADEGDGYVIALVYDGATHTSHWAFFDTRGIADGPIGRAHLDHHVPAAFHGLWVPALSAPNGAPEATRPRTSRKR